MSTPASANGTSQASISCGVARPRGLHLLRRRRKLRGVILKFPLRDAQTNWKVRADGGADGANQFCGESGALRQTLATVMVGALIGGMPKKLVNQIPMCSMNLDRVKSQRFGCHGRLREHPGRLGTVG